MVSLALKELLSSSPSPASWSDEASGGSWFRPPWLVGAREGAHTCCMLCGMYMGCCHCRVRQEHMIQEGGDEERSGMATSGLEKQGPLWGYL